MDFDLSSLFDSDSFFGGVGTSLSDAVNSNYSNLLGALSTAADTASSAADTTGSTSSWWDSILGGASTLGKTLTSPAGLSAISGATGLLTNYLGGSAAQSAARKALEQLQQAYGLAASSTDEKFKTALALGQPYRELGTGLLPTYAQFASGADTGRQTLQQLVNGGLYDWQKGQVLDTIDKAMAARGRYDSGAAVKAQMDAVNALSANEANQRFGRQLTLENMDYGRLNDAINIGGGFSSSAAGLASNTGAQQASIYQNLGNSVSQAENTIGSTTKSMYTGLNNAVQGGLNSYYSNNLAQALGGF